MNKQLMTTAGALGLLLAVAPASNATIIGFGQLGGSNTDIALNYGSNAAADNFGLVVSNGATPNIALDWTIPSDDWEVHTSSHFAAIEDETDGGGDWDDEGDIPRIGQLDVGFHTIGFAADAGFALVLNSFDFGHTAETSGNTSWNLTLADSGATTVWSQTVDFVDGQVFTIAPNFTGNLGESYTLTFERTSETYNSNGRHAIDNLSFNQTDVPEPGSLALLGLGGLALLRRRR